MVKKKGQMQISFGMIVSIILIITFLAIAFYSISKFLEWQRIIQIGQFTDKLQLDIDKIWKSSQGSEEISYKLPARIGEVCIVDFNSPERGIDSSKYFELQRGYYGAENLVIYPISAGEGLESIKINHIDLQKITEKNNPSCFENTKGNTKLTISMDFGESLVTIK